MLAGIRFYMKLAASVLGMTAAFATPVAIINLSGF
jgi:hypothetical protein